MAAVDSPITDVPGVFTIVLGAEEGKRRIRGVKGKVDDMLYELVDAIAFHASDQLRIHAPGHISELVDTDLATEVEPHHFHAAAGVTPGESKFVSRRGSRRADYPLYVEGGTGVYGETGSPILAVPRHLMGPIDFEGRDIFLSSIQGQHAQHYAERSFEEAVSWTPARIELSKAALAARLET